MAIIPLGAAVSRALRRPTRKPGAAALVTFPYLVLLPVGLPRGRLRGSRGELLPPVSPLPDPSDTPENAREPSAVCFLLHFPAVARPGVTQHRALRSSTFLPGVASRGDRPTCSRHSCNTFQRRPIPRGESGPGRRPLNYRGALARASARRFPAGM